MTEKTTTFPHRFRPKSGRKPVLCEQCGQVFEAKTTVTRFCSKLCNKRNYKQNIRNSKVAPMDQVVKKVLDKSTPDLTGVQFLSVKAAAALLGASEKCRHRNFEKFGSFFYIK
jgi:hypothetical protein